MIEYIVTIDDDGTKEWYLNGKLHREDGPACEYADGTKCWYLNGVRHREDGPAIEWADGTKFWYLNGKLHHEDGPAIEWADGTKFWYLNGDKFWYLNGEEVTEEEHKRRTGPTKELTVQEISDLLGYNVKVVK